LVLNLFFGGRMIILTWVSFLLLVMLLMSMIAKAKPFMRHPIPGKFIRKMPMSFWARVQFQRPALVAIVFGTGFGVAAGWLPGNAAFMLGAMVGVVMIMPMDYTFTTEGVAFGGGVFYRWNEFTGVRKQQSRVFLETPKAMRNMTLHLNPVEMSQIFGKLKGYPKLEL